MAPLACASVSDIYGKDFGLTPEQIASQILTKESNNKTSSSSDSVSPSDSVGPVGPVSPSGPVGPVGPVGPAVTNNVEFGTAIMNALKPRHREFYSSNDALQHMIKLLEEGLMLGKIILLILVLLFLIKLFDKR